MDISWLRTCLDVRLLHMGDRNGVSDDIPAVERDEHGTLHQTFENESIDSGNKRLELFRNAMSVNEPH